MNAPASDREVVFDDLEIGEISMELEHEPPQEVLRWALDVFGDRVALVTSLQVNSMVLLDMISQMDRHTVKVFTVDTGRLPEETLDFLDTARERYPDQEWRVLFPDTDEVEAMVERNGINLFKKSVSNRFVCCHIRKVRPLTRALENLDAWMTGLRRDEWASRAAIDKIELDHDHGGVVKI
ncbi:MAG: phosphoadenylyl-sulfate reductase, partial [Bradymonadaceae bacterium]